jgi:hypothetical protein
VVFKSIKYFLEEFRRVILDPIIGISILLGVPIAYFIHTNYLSLLREDKESIYIDLLVEAHGLIFDILFFSIILGIYNYFIEKKRNINRYEEEIDDFRGWNEKEATYRIIGNINRLMRKGVTKVNLRNCHLYGAQLLLFNLQGSDLERANLSKSTLHKGSLRNANLKECNLSGAFISFVDLRGANMTKADLREIKIVPRADITNVIFDMAIVEDMEWINKLEGYSQYIEGFDWLKENYHVEKTEVFEYRLMRNYNTIQSKD